MVLFWLLCQFHHLENRSADARVYFCPAVAEEVVIRSTPGPLSAVVSLGDAHQPVADSLEHKPAVRLRLGGAIPLRVSAVGEAQRTESGKGKC